MLEGSKCSRISSVGVERGGRALELKTVLAGQSHGLRRSNPCGTRSADVEWQVDDLVVARDGFAVRRAEARIFPLSRGEELRGANERVGASNRGARAPGDGGFDRLLSGDGLLAPRRRRYNEEECGEWGNRSHQEIYDYRPKTGRVGQGAFHSPTPPLAAFGVRSVS